jgi:NitT/TauT family transport system permease protein
MIFLPAVETTDSPIAFLAVVIATELGLLYKRKSKVACDIGIIVYLFFLFWEYKTAKIGVKNAMLYPAPENVFYIFIKDYKKILEGVGSSLRLLFTAFALALVFGVGLGLLVGLSDRLSGTILPIVKVISPIPPIIYSPYAVALLPSFRMASIFVVTMTIFWSIFMNMVLSVRQIDKKIMDSARTLNVNKATMILHILLPYSLPGIINSVTVSVSTSFLVLTAAEMIGATSGLGWYIKYHSDFANFTKVIFGIFMIGIVVTVLNVLIAAVRKVLIRWR